MSFIERDLSSGSSTGPVPALEAQRPSTKTKMRNTEPAANPQKLAAWRTWVPPHHLGTSLRNPPRYLRLLARRRPAEPPSATKTKTTTASSPT